MKAVFEYDQSTGEIKDRNGLAVFMSGMTPFEAQEDPAPVLELIKQGVTPDELIKLRNNGLI